MLAINISYYKMSSFSNVFVTNVLPLFLRRVYKDYKDFDRTDRLQTLTPLFQ
jgi:hypothetical protein